MAKRLAESRIEMAPPVKKEEVVVNDGEIVAITSRDKGCDITIRVSQPPSVFRLGQIIKV